MIFDIACQMGRTEVVQGGKRPFTKCSVVLMGCTLSLILPEKLVPDWMEGHAAVIQVQLSAGQYGRPDLRILKVTRS